MKVTKSLIYETVKTAVGEDVLKLVDYIKDRKNISEFKIAEKLGTEVNQTRNMLYRLHSLNLVTYHKKKDRQKGWYISYWTFQPRKIKDVIRHLHRKKLDELKERLEKEMAYKNNFFMCPKMCTRMGFHKATEFDFKCPECGNIMDHQDNSKTIDNLRLQIDEMERVERKYKC